MDFTISDWWVMFKGPRIRAISIILFVLLTSAFVGLKVGNHPPRSSLYRTTFLEICHLVDLHYFENTSELKEWVSHCRQTVGEIPNTISMADFFKKVEFELYRLPVSHLEIWDPTSNRLLWTAESKETGLRAREIDGRFVVYNVIDGSPADDAGIDEGDEILSVNNETVEDTYNLRFDGGAYELRRGKKQFQVQLAPQVIQLNEDPELFELNPSVAWLKIPSFIADHFGDENVWKDTIKVMSRYTHLIVDVRGNAGGDFVAMLRSLSGFYCEPTAIGTLIQPRMDQMITRNAPDNLETDVQAMLLNGAGKVKLVTFPGYPCFKGKITVLADEGTASTAEIFTEALMQRPNSRFWGGITSGSVVLAAWYPLPLGAGYKISIPISMYETKSGERLEGVGIRPQKTLKYEVESALAGEDSWVLRALQL